MRLLEAPGHWPWPPGANFTAAMAFEMPIGQLPSPGYRVRRSAHAPG